MVNTIYFHFSEKPRRIITPVATRWNSLAMCVQSVVELKFTMRALAADTGHDLHDIIPTDRQFDELQKLLQPLLLIKQTSERLSADKPSLHIVMCGLFSVMTMSREPRFQLDSSPSTKAFVEKFEAEMQKRLSDYGRTIPEYCVGQFLHPNFKGYFLKAKTSRDYEPVHFEETIDLIKDFFRTSVPETEMQSAQDFDTPSILNVALNESQWAQLPTFLSQSMPLSETAAPERSPIELELETYLKVLPSTSGVDIDILAYWKSQEKVLPLLSRFARRYFGIPVSSASSERLFSAAGNVITENRTLLSTERAEQLIYIHDNYWDIEKTIKSWKIRPDRERGQNRSQPETSEDMFADPRPGTSSQSQSQTPRSKGSATAARFRTPTSSRRPVRHPDSPDTPHSDSDESDF